MNFWMILTATTSDVSLWSERRWRKLKHYSGACLSGWRTGWGRCWRRRRCSWLMATRTRLIVTWQLWPDWVRHIMTHTALAAESGRAGNKKVFFGNCRILSLTFIHQTFLSFHFHIGVKSYMQYVTFSLYFIETLPLGLNISI